MQPVHRAVSNQRRRRRPKCIESRLAAFEGGLAGSWAEKAQAKPGAAILQRRVFFLYDQRVVGGACASGIEK